MTLEHLRPFSSRILAPAVRVANSAGVTPNSLSLLAFIFAIFAATAFYFATELSYLVGGIFVFLNGVFDTLDGGLARYQGIQSDAGEFLDRSLDRYADAFIIVSISVGADRLVLGLAAVTGALLTSFIGSQAQAVGLNRIKGGLISGSDRLALITIMGISYGIVPRIYDYSIVVWTLGLLAILGHFTGIQRFISAWKSFR